MPRNALKVAAAQPRARLNSLERNVESHAEAVRRANSQLIVFPEMSLTGYAMDAPSIDPSGTALAPLVRACAASNSTALVGAPVDVGGGRGIGVLAVDAAGAQLAYVKMSLGGAEVENFLPGREPATLVIDGWKIGLGVCKDTRIDDHLEATGALGIDLYAAGLVHTPAELGEFDVRAQRITQQFHVPVIFAGFAGSTGGGFDATSGGSGVWDGEGRAIARCGAGCGEIAIAELQ